MSELDTDPSKPIPNDDPRCRCALEPGSDVGEDAVLMRFGDGMGGEGRLAVYPDCPHHGLMARIRLEGLSIGL